MDARQSTPSAARNRDAILEVVRRAISPDARVLEIASGSGEHVVHFARAMPQATWFPSDPDDAARASIAAWIAAEGVSNVAPPLAIDASAPAWGVEAEALFDAVLAINMIHISPWEATLGLMAGAGRVLRDGGVLITYGAYKRGGAHTAPSNEAFDEWLKQCDPAFGVRDMADVEAAARAHGLVLRDIVAMPANNFTLVFVRNGGA
jgi:cyclopropane fatty-acyl-phospholipid synthase-like methyltransferase